MADYDDRSGRDSRLLALVIVIAIAVLVVLARFRFPQTDAGPVTVAPGPLERLAARATYDDLAAAVYSALLRVTPTLVTVTLEQEAPAKPGTPAAESPVIQPPSLPDRRLPAVRLRGEYAVVHVPRGYRPAAASRLIANGFDAGREVAVVSVPALAGEAGPTPATAEFSGFSYLMVIEATAGELTASPVFVGRADAVPDERWGGQVLIPGGSLDLPPGALVFRLDGRFIGMVTPAADGRRAIVPAMLLEAAIAAMTGAEAGGAP